MTPCSLSRKNGYDDKQEAFRHATALKVRRSTNYDRKNGVTGLPLLPYKCGYCNRWHVGHHRKRLIMRAEEKQCGIVKEKTLEPLVPQRP